MKKDEVKFTVRLHPEVAHKLSYVAQYYGRSQNSQISFLARMSIIEFEKEHGKIELGDDTQ